MGNRMIWGITAAAIATAIAAVHLTAQAPASQSRNRRVWTGTIDDREILLNAHDTTPIRRPVRYFQDVQVSFTFISEDDPNRPGLMRWVSRHLSWHGYAKSWSSIEGRECRGDGNLDLGPADDYGTVTAAQEPYLKIPCRDWATANAWAFIPMPNPKVRLPEIVQMTNCEPTRRWSSAGVRYTLSVSPTEMQAAFRFEKGKEAPPFPGKTYAIRGWSNVLGRWKFVVESSRLRGFATNADVSSAFFSDLYPATQSMSGRYTTWDPDLVFNPTLARAPSDWKPPSPDQGSRKWSVLETTDATSVNRVDAELTAMDFGAHGEVRAYMSPSCGGGWKQVPVEGGGSFLKFPAEDDDNNFIPDREQAYRGLAALSDEDDEPDGDGNGDGFTAFEEYRGFIATARGSCGNPMNAAYSGRTYWGRTNPKKKNLFIHAPDPILRWLATTFSKTSGLEVWTICPEEYVDNDTRVVNFTMHARPGQLVVGAGLRGAPLTQARPQHGLYLVNARIADGPLGQTVPVDPSRSVLGPPRNIRRVEVDPVGIRWAYGMAQFLQFLTVITHHELGHAVGHPHHGEDNIPGPVVLLNMTRCGAGMIEGTVDGRPACSATGIAVRGQQNSGNALCPMKYLHWKWYVPPSSALIKNPRPVDFKVLIFGLIVGALQATPAPLDAYEGLVLRYQKERDEPPPPDKMKFCTAPDGTGVNALPEDDNNHAGRIGRGFPCSFFLRVNDVPLSR